jgi:hypothetical protein
MISTINSLNIEINNKSTKNIDKKEKELKLLNELYASIRKYNTFKKDDK